MKSKFFFLSLLFFIVIASSGYCQSKNNNIVIGTIDTLHSSILNENRPIWVHVPGSSPNNIYSPTRYPVIYLLDGDAHFDYVVGMMHQLSQVNGNTICPEMIIVGIPNTDRTRDLTPTHSDVGLDGDSNFVKTSGGGEIFTAFIEKELIPHIDSLYPTAPYRMIIGHSLGGLLVVNALLNHSNLFNSYLAIDPSLWWDNQVMLKQASKELNTMKFDDKRLFLVMANTIPSQMDTLTVRSVTSNTTEHIRSILQFSDMLKRKSNNGLLFSWKYYEQDTHGSVPLIGTYDALHFFFDYFRLPSYEVIMERLDNIDSLLEAYSGKLLKNMGYKTLLPESFINTLGYICLGNKMLSKAFSLFEMNIKNYPNSFNVYDSMGDYYSEVSNKEKAIEYFEKALRIKENPESRRKLEKLKSNK